ncbi:PASTA domain-containing protein [Kitasatospora sp. NPDC058965]|uniref:PASTA domain-containing protein n=1 Tax=Kitasatospora sp. NPDC058965 TaxID=3346682 RepID=UPI0036BB333D
MTSPQHRTGPDGPATDDDFGKALIQAMDEFSRATPAPAFDSDGIVRRTRRRRGGLALTGVAAVAAAGVTLAVVLTASPQPTVSAAAVSTPSSPAHTDDGTSGPTRKAVPVPDLAGLTLQQAQALLTAAGLDAHLTYSDQKGLEQQFPAAAQFAGPDGVIPAGTVVGTIPAAGSQAFPGGIVGVFYVHG